MTIRSLALVAAAGIMACAADRWQPYFEPDEDPQRGIVPNVTFGTVLECQQYLVNRFGNLKATGTYYCYRGCRRIDPDSPTIPGSDRLGDIDCSRSDRQIVGQLIG